MIPHFIPILKLNKNWFLTLRTEQDPVVGVAIRQWIEGINL